jgi:hypothetical protein
MKRIVTEASANKDGSALLVARTVLEKGRFGAVKRPELVIVPTN